MKKHVIGAALAGLALIAACACSSNGTASTGEIKTIKEGVITVASDLDYKPLEFLPEGSTDPSDAEGFEVDMVTEAAKRIGYEVEYLPPVKFDTIVPMIKQGSKADIGASSFTITDERKEEVDFTDPFMNSNQGCVVSKDFGEVSIDILNSADMKIAVQAGTTGEEWVRENCPEATCVPLDNTSECMTGCLAGNYDAVVADLPVMEHLCSVSYTDLMVGLEIPTGEQYGIIVSKDNPALTEALNKALAEMEEDGTMDELEQKWFGTTL